MIASEDGSGVWTVQIVKINPQVSVNSVHWYLLDVQGNTKTDGLVSDVYGYYSGQGKAVVFIDNDFNGKLSPGDKFEVHPGEADSDLASVSDVSDYSFRMKFEPTGDVIGYDISTIVELVTENRAGLQSPVHQVNGGFGSHLPNFYFF